jgi:hypothetical protein
MPLHQQILTTAPIDRPDLFRLKALVCEQRAGESTDPTSKQDWKKLAIEWRAMANLAATMNCKISQTEVA